MKQLRIFGVLLTLVSLGLLPSVFAQPQFEIPLTVSDGVDSKIIYLGILPTANFCINPADSLNGHVEGELPPFPPSGVFEARFVNHRTVDGGCFGEGTPYDYRPFLSGTQKDTFKVKTQMGTGTGMTISWPSGLSTYFNSLTLKDNFGGVFVNVNMLTATTADLGAFGLLECKIYGDGLPVPVPGFGVAPSSVAFGSVAVGSTKDDSVTVTNTGAATLNITAINSTHAAYSVLPAAPQTLAPAASMKFYITFAPTGGGSANGQIQFTDNASGSPHSVNVSGTGIAPVTVTPDPYGAGSVVVGCTGNFSNVFTLTNNSGGTVTIDSVLSSDGQFSVTPQTASVPAAGTAMFSLAFAPTAVGAQSTTLSFYYSGAVGSPLSVGANGTGTTYVSIPASLPFGSIQQIALPTCPGTSATVDLTVTNNSCTLPFDITAVGIGDAAYTLLTSLPVTVPAAGNAILQFQFGPVAGPIGAHPDNFSITHTGPGSPGSVSATGTVQPCVEPLFVTLPPDSISGPGAGYLRPVYRPWRGTSRYPNWANLVMETVVQGGFQPASSESDSAGGMRIGMSFMKQGYLGRWLPAVQNRPGHDTAWVRLTSWIPARNMGAGYTVLQYTLKQRYGVSWLTHDGSDPARGLDSTGAPGDARRLPMRGQFTRLYPSQTNNGLFAELVALKFSLAANDLGKAGDPGLGDQLLNISGNPMNGLTIRQISAYVDDKMTFWPGVAQADWDSMYATLFRINRVFAGPLDTVTWMNPRDLKVAGVAGVSATGGWLLPSLAPPVMLEPTNTMTESQLEFDDPEAVGAETSTPALKLYQNFPNPFNPTTNINFAILDPARVTLKVYNVLGQEMATLLDNEEVQGGFTEVSFDASRLSSGVYFYTVTGEDVATGTMIQRSIGKMLLVK